MAQEEYAYAVASVRIKESTLLSTGFLEQLLSTDTYQSVFKQLIEHGWLSGNSESDDKKLGQRLIDCWDFLTGISPHPEKLYSLVVKNDFHNLKAALKCSFTDIKPERYFIRPCLYDIAELADAVYKRNFDKLPLPLAEAAQRAHGVFIKTQNGQYTDIIIDAAALAQIQKLGQSSKNDLIGRLSTLAVASANIKTAIRAARTNKDLYFLDSAICECESLDKTHLISETLKGTDALYAYLESTPYAEAVKTTDGSLSALEKWFDDKTMELIETAKSSFFGPEPLVAYYIAKETELRNIRILLAGKRHGADDSVVRERMRKLYV